MKQQILSQENIVTSGFIHDCDDVTLEGAKVYSEQKSLLGSVVDYVAEPEAIKRVSNYTQVRLDPSIVEYANRNGVSLGSVIESMDPVSNYHVDDPMGKLTALQRQYVRYGFLRKDNSVPFAYSVAHTPANTVLFPSFRKSQLFWDPLIDMDLDPNDLYSSTRMQAEETFQQVKINDSQWRNRRQFKQSEMSEVPSSKLTLNGYNGSLSKHGVGLWYSREFAMKVSMDLFTKAIQRMAIKDRRQHFEHIIYTLQNGDNTYGIGTGLSTVYAEDYDPVGCTGNGEISFLALSLFLYGQRPYSPTVAVQNVNTFHKYIEATPPQNVVSLETLRVLAAAQYPMMPRAKNYDFMGQTPPALVVPNDVLADNVIMFLDTKNCIEHVVQTGMEVNDLGYDMEHQTYKHIWTMKDGIGALPPFYDAGKIMSLTIT